MADQPRGQSEVVWYVGSAAFRDRLAVSESRVDCRCQAAGGCGDNSTAVSQDPETHPDPNGGGSPSGPEG